MKPKPSFKTLIRSIQKSDFIAQKSVAWRNLTCCASAIGGFMVWEISERALVAPLDGNKLLFYMLRRFGSPSGPVDAGKALCSWVLTTSMKDIHLLVTPYPSKDYHHFGVAAPDHLRRRLADDQSTVDFKKTAREIVGQWWRDKGCKDFKLVLIPKQSPVGDWNDKILAYLGGWNDSADFVIALVNKDASTPFKTTTAFQKIDIGVWCQVLSQMHPKQVRWPKLGRARPSEFQREAANALATTMRDLYRPVALRDSLINAAGFTDDLGAPFGRIVVDFSAEFPLS